MRRSEVFKFLVHSVEGKVTEQRIVFFLTKRRRLVKHHRSAQLDITLVIEVTSTLTKKSEVALTISKGWSLL